MTSAVTFRTPYENRVTLVKDAIKAHSKLGDKAADDLAVNVLEALDTIPEKMRYRTMTVTVTLPDGGADAICRFGDRRQGVIPLRTGGWTDVAGDEKSWKKGFFRR